MKSLKELSVLLGIAENYVAIGQTSARLDVAALQSLLTNDRDSEKAAMALWLVVKNDKKLALMAMRAVIALAVGETESREEGHAIGVKQDQPRFSDLPRTEREEKPEVAVPQGQTTHDLPSVTSGAEQIRSATKASIAFSPTGETSLSEAARILQSARAPSRSQLAAAGRVGKAAARSIFDQIIGGSLSLGNATQFDFINFVRKSMIATHIGNRIMNEIPWPDKDKTPLKQVATEKQVREIFESRPPYLPR
jgi:hypothetical protein